MVKLGTTYETQCGNRVKIFETFEEDDSEGRSVRIFKGVVVKAIKGHEKLLNKILRYTEEGFWQRISDSGKWATLRPSQHALKKEIP